MGIAVCSYILERYFTLKKILNLPLKKTYWATRYSTHFTNSRSFWILNNKKRIICFVVENQINQLLDM